MQKYQEFLAYITVFCWIVYMILGSNENILMAGIAIGALINMALLGLFSIHSVADTTEHFHISWVHI